MQKLHGVHHRLNDLVSSDASRQARYRPALSTLPDYDETCMKEGFLQKKGQRLKGWKRRWFVCNGRTLTYYISRKDRKPSGVIYLEGCTVEDGGKSETWNSTRIHLTDGVKNVTYCLSGDDHEVVMEWLTVLRAAIAQQSKENGDAPANEGAETNGSKHSSSKTLSARMGTSLSDDETHSSSSLAPSAPVLAVSHSSSGIGLPAGASTNDAALASKRLTRLASAPAHVLHAPLAHARAQRTKTAHLATSISLENELAHGLDLLESLLNNRANKRNSVVFRPIDAVNGVLKSMGSDATGEKWYVRASAILPVPVEVASFFLTNHAKRAEWDIHFPEAVHVASFDDSTELVYLPAKFHQIGATKPFVSPAIAAGCGVVVGIIFSPFVGNFLMTAVVAAVLSVIVNSLDYASVCYPRDLLLLRHVRESSALDWSSNAGDDVESPGEEDAQSVVTIMEKSVANERKPPLPNVVRAHVSLSGWLLEPVGESHTRATFLTDFDAKGALSMESSKLLATQRLQCLAVLLEHLTQAQLTGTSSFGIDEDQESIDGKIEEPDEERGAFVNDCAEEGLTSNVFHPSAYMKGMLRNPSGGLKITDKEIAKKQAGVLKEVIKQMGVKILEGKGVVSLSLPVRIFEARTNLERAIDLFLYGPTFLNAAADQTDPVERFKMVMAFAVAGMHHGVGQLKPFNPILGETLQCSLNDGTEVFCEHTSHHPPISNFQLEGKKYEIAGYIYWHGSFSMKSNALIQSNRSKISVNFADGTAITYHLPLIQSGGFLWGDRTVELLGNVVFEDKKNGLYCDLKFNPDERKGMGSMFGSSSKTPSDILRGVLMNTTTNREMCEVSGSWLDELCFNGKPYWTYGRERSGCVVPLADNDPSLLPSDSRFREDLRYLAADDQEGAQDWKIKLEVLQRADRKVRLDGRHPNHWSLVKK